jgi:hypothetical protein
MSLEILQNLRAIAPGIVTPFVCNSSDPVTWAVTAGGAGGTINEDGIYTAPQLSSYDPKKFIDTITVDDGTDTGTTTIMVLPVLGLLAHIIQTELELNMDQVQLYQQKFNVPNDNKVYIAVGMLTQKPYANKREYYENPDSLDLMEVVSTNWKCTAWIEIYSASNLAFLRKEEISAALFSTYSEQIQEANNFKIAKMPSQFTNISSAQGPGIPYRFNASVQLSFVTSKEKPIAYFEELPPLELNVDE